MMSSHRRAYRTLLAFAVLWNVAIVSTPVLQSSEHFQQPASILRSFFSRICHQRVERSLVVLDSPLPVCSRCAAIYSAFLVGIMAFSPHRQRQWIRTHDLTLFAGLSVPMALDVFGGWIGIHQPVMITRIVSGAFFGIGASILLSESLLFAFEIVLSRIDRYRGIRTCESKT